MSGISFTSPTSWHGSDPSMEILAVSLSKSQQKMEGETVLKLLDAAAEVKPAASVSSLGQHINIQV